jgi:chemotaxis protein MotB
VSEAPHEIVIVRRRGSSEEEHHGGAWKIAFADFMTAMMAFFLVLWIISATDKNTKTIIARYFNPVKVEEPAKAQKGIHGAPEQNAEAPGEDSKAPKVEKPRPDAAEGNAEPAPASGAVDAKTKRPKPDSPIPPDPSKPNPTLSEEELFRDPRASLDKIAGAPPPGPRVDPTAAMKGYGQVGPSADEALRDPFRPLGSDRALNVAATDPGAPSSAPNDAPPNLEASDLQNAAPAAPSKAPAGAALAEAAAVVPEKTEPPETKAEQAAESSPTQPAPAPSASKAEEAAGLLAEVKKRLGSGGQAVAGPQLDVRATDEGILISLTDRQNFAMFALGSAEPQQRVIKMMDAIAMSLVAMPGQLVVRGHTDAHPYRSATYDNWRLSSARAQMAYYMLVRGGMPEKRFDRIEGFADHRLKEPTHPLAAENRRIEILLREATP